MRSDELLESGAQELLSPLANVLGFAHLLNRLAANRPADWSPESRSSIGMLVGEAERLKTVAEAFIEQLRLQEGVFALHPDEVEVDGLVHEEVRAFGRRWPHSQLTEDFADSAPTLRTDEARFRFVVRALLDGAARSGATNGRVTVRGNPLGGATVTVPISIVDADVGALIVSSDATTEGDDDDLDLPSRVTRSVARRLGLSIVLARQAGHPGGHLVLTAPGVPPPEPAAAAHPSSVTTSA
ncbi:MAG: hypothetical protein U0360_04685 [Dehalococcoidia bacterium]